MTRMTRCILALPLMLVIASGCSSSKSGSSVQGTVTYNGQKVTAGTVTFHRTGGADKDSEQKGTYAFVIQPDGTYKGSSLPKEEMVVTVETETANPEHQKQKGPAYGPPAGQGMSMKEQQDMYKKKMAEQGAPVDAAQGGTYTKIPEKYSDPKQSPLRKKFSGGKETFNIELTD